MRHAAIPFVALVVALAVLPGVAAADSRAGGSVVVGPNETVDGLSAFGGTVVVRGTVNGDLDGYAGTVIVEENGTVTGDLKAYAGSVRVEGTVGGNVVAYAGVVDLADTGVVRGSLGAVAGEVVVAGRVAGDVTAGAETLHLAPTARVGGDVNYDGRLERAAGARVAGQVRQVREVGLGPALPDLPTGVLVLYGVLSNLLFGAILLYGVEDFSTAVAENAILDTVPSLLVGLGTTVAVPLALLGLALTVVGLPVAVVALLALPAAGWVAAVYGRFAVGAWLLSYADVERPVAGLAAGVVLVALLAQVPYGVGTVVRAFVLVLGLGALVVELRARLGARGRY
ncbi:MAG: polymer-forming cytoskeletal protein [Haloferacaceae archaeon]